MDGFEEPQLAVHCLETHLLFLRQFMSLGELLTRLSGLQCDNTTFFLESPNEIFYATSFTAIGVVIRGERSNVRERLRGRRFMGANWRWDIKFRKVFEERSAEGGWREGRSLGIGIRKATPGALSSVMTICALGHLVREARNNYICCIWAMALLAADAGMSRVRGVFNNLSMMPLDINLLQAHQFLHLCHVLFCIMLQLRQSIRLWAQQPPLKRNTRQLDK
jgi:hypothetical protein